MKATKLLLLSLAVAGLAACDHVGPDKSYDRGINSHPLSSMQAGVWIDPEGCDHWIIDDGMEGYMTERVDDYGKPICSGAGPANTVVGPFKGGSEVPDTL